MRLGIIGLPQSGKSTVFDALTRSVAVDGNRRESRIGTITVPDRRVDVLSGMYHPRKTIFAQVAYLLPGKGSEPGGSLQKEQGIWTQVRDCDALIHTVRNFRGYGLEAPTPKADIAAIDQELIISDLVVVEKRLERLALDERRGKKPDLEEAALLTECKAHLDDELPLRRFPEIAAAKVLRGFAFLSAKPMLILFNNNDEDDALPGSEFHEELDWFVFDSTGRLRSELPGIAGWAFAEYEAALRLGRTTALRTAEQVRSDEHERIVAYGAMARVGAAATSGTGSRRWARLVGSVEWGWASGDADPYDGTLRRFDFNPNHNVGLILFD